MRTSFLSFALFLLVGVSAFAQKDMKADIGAANQKFMDTFQQGATNMGSLYTTDAKVFPPGSEPIQGNAAISTFWKGAFDAGIKRAKLETLEAEQSGDQITEVGRYTLYGANQAQADAGKYIVVWKQEGGSWKLHRDIWNSNTPATMAAK